MKPIILSGLKTAHCILGLMAQLDGSKTVALHQVGEWWFVYFFIFHFFHSFPLGFFFFHFLIFTSLSLFYFFLMVLVVFLDLGFLFFLPKRRINCSPY